MTADEATGWPGVPGVLVQVRGQMAGLCNPLASTGRAPWCGVGVRHLPQPGPAESRESPLGQDKQGWVSSAKSPAVCMCGWATLSGELHLPQGGLACERPPAPVPRVSRHGMTPASSWAIK